MKNLKQESGWDQGCEEWMRIEGVRGKEPGEFTPPSHSVEMF
jgi:hypothetical protein